MHDEAAKSEHMVGGAPLTLAATTNLPEFQPMEIEGISGQATAECTAGGQPGSPPLASRGMSLFNPPIASLASITEEDFRRIFARSPIKRAKYRGWVRNLCVAMGN